MEKHQVPYNFVLPLEVLNRLKEQSKKTGIPVAGLIKIAVAEKYREEESKS